MHPKAKARSKLFETKQNENERMSDFATRIAEDAMVAYENEDMRRCAMLDVFVTGVWDDGIGKDLLKAKHTDFEEAVKEAIELEAVYQSRETDNSKSHIIYNLTAETKKCYNCEKIGHLQRDCPEPRKPTQPKCYNCGKLGHLAKACYRRNDGRRPGRDSSRRNSSSGGRNQRRVPTCRSCNREGHYANECPHVTCYKCNQQGHVSSNCQVAPNNAVERALRDNRQPPSNRMQPRTNNFSPASN